MKYIPLTQGKVAIVDDDDYEHLSKWRWYYFSKSYAARHDPNNHAQIIFMHRQILNPPEGMYADHINGNKLDNRRCNLRIVTHQQNMVNKGPRKDNKSGYKGIRWYDYAHNGRPCWIVSIAYGGKRKTIGRFDKLEDAIKARLDAEILYHGQFTRK